MIHYDDYNSYYYAILYSYLIRRHSVFVNSFSRFSSLTVSKPSEKIPSHSNSNCKNTKLLSIKQLALLNAFHLKMLQPFLLLPSHYHLISVMLNLLRKLGRLDYPNLVLKSIE